MFHKNKITQKKIKINALKLKKVQVDETEYKLKAIKEQRGTIYVEEKKVHQKYRTIMNFASLIRYFKINKTKNNNHKEILSS